jgi:hypothetical protein
MAGHAAVVEYHQQLGPLAQRDPDHMGREGGDRRRGELAVGVGEQLAVTQAEHPGGVGELRRAHVGEVVRAAAQGRCLAPGEAQAPDRGPGVDERAEDRPEPERFVVGVGVDGERRAGPGWEVQ